MSACVLFLYRKVMAEYDLVQVFDSIKVTINGKVGNRIEYK
jgi:hypothetical protein